MKNLYKFYKSLSPNLLLVAAVLVCMATTLAAQLDAVEREGVETAAASVDVAKVMPVVERATSKNPGLRLTHKVKFALSRLEEKEVNENLSKSEVAYSDSEHERHSSNSKQKIYGLRLNLILEQGEAAKYRIYSNLAGDVGHPFKIKVDGDNSDNLALLQIGWPESERQEVEAGEQKFSAYFFGEKAALDLYFSPVDSLPRRVEVALRLTYSLCSDLCILEKQNLRLSYDPISQEFEIGQLNLPSQTAARQDIQPYPAPAPASAAVTVEAAAEAAALAPTQPANDAPLFDLFFIILLAIGGGLILNVMPCVFPVLSIKIIHLMKHKNAGRSSFRKHLLCLIMGMLFFFLTLFIFTVCVRLMNGSVLWGEQFQSPAYGVVMSFVMLFIVNSFFGYSRVDLPSSLRLAASRLHVQSEYLNSFFFGLLITLLATPCTAPMLGMALSFTIGKSLWITAVIYLSIAFGLALPYVVMVIFPGLSAFIPKPGKWLMVAEKVFALPIIATIVWLLNIIEAQTNMQMLLVVIVALLGFQVVIICCKHRLISERLGIISGFTILVLAAVLSLLYDEGRETGADLGNHASSKRDSIALVPRIPWQEFDQRLLHDTVAAGGTVVVNVTAKWCLTCQANDIVFAKPEVISAFMQHRILALRADYTKNSAVIKDYIVANQRQGIPLTVIYGPAAKEGVILSEVVREKDLRQTLMLVLGLEQ